MQRAVMAGWIILCVAGAVRAAEIPPGAEEFFEKRVRPVLVGRCLACHGPQKQSGGLRLDTADGMRQGGDSGPAVLPGNIADSLLISAIQRKEDLKMPPDRALPPAEAEALALWVQGGAIWPETKGRPVELAAGHWAFQPITRPELPEVTKSDWAQGDIDRFILAGLEAAGLEPAPPAERRQLIRRVTLDLTGLPPTPEEVAAFLADETPEAYAKVVDRLLASPRYGERWARHWLDVARYADTKGYVFFENANYPWAYTYRDYVVKAFNDDLPYDRFVMEQLAADQLEPKDDPSKLAALGFLTVGGHFMNNSHDIIDDRIDVVTRGLIGLTVSCARCHDHKYDPIPTTDYYALYGMFKSSYEPMVPPLVGPPPDTDEYRAFAQEMETREKALRDFILGKFDALVNGSRARADEYLAAVEARHGLPNAEEFMLLADPNDINPSMITRWEAYLERMGATHHPVWRPWHALIALPDLDFAVKAADVLKALAEEAAPINPLVLQTLREPPLENRGQVAARYGALLKKVEADWQAAVAAASSTGGAAPTALPDAAAEELRQVLYGRNTPPDIPVEMDWGFLSLFPDRATQGEYQKFLKAVEEWSMTGKGAPARAMVLLDSERPFEPRVFERGNPHRLGAAVPRRVPGVMAAAAGGPDAVFKNGSGRLELAQAIVDPRNPLTARVFVNRVWAEHFGTGLVRTTGDFGLRSERPSHPELLDFLADEFIRGGWSVKRLHRGIVMSATYQQSGLASAATKAADPENRWLGRMSRRRLDFEATRDSLLAVSGMLQETVGGPAVDIFNGLSPRRTIYGQIDRMNVPPLLTTFDFPNPAAASTQRDQTTVSPQALYFMNHDHIATVAEQTLKRADVAPLDTPGRITRLYELCFARPPREAELAAGQTFLGETPDPAAWNRYVHALLMTNEMVFVD